MKPLLGSLLLALAVHAAPVEFLDYSDSPSNRNSSPSIQTKLDTTITIQISGKDTVKTITVKQDVTQKQLQEQQQWREIAEEVVNTDKHNREKRLELAQLAMILATISTVVLVLIVFSN